MKKFLVFSCLILLISIVYFIHTRCQMHTESKNQQKVTGELEAPSVGHVSASRSSQPRIEESNPVPTEEEWAAFEEFLGNLEELERTLEGTTETTQPEPEGITDAEVYEASSETEGDDTGISPELKATFIVVNDWRDTQRAYFEKIDPLMREYAPLGEIEVGIIHAISGTSGEENRRLHEELRQVQSKKQELADLMAPFGRAREQANQELVQYLQENHGMDMQQFFDTHGEVFESWRRAQ